MASAAPEHRPLPDRPDEIAPDGSEVRVLGAVAGASLAHFTLHPGQVSVPQRHRTVSELWFVLGGRGAMWRRGAGVGDVGDVGGAVGDADAGRDVEVRLAAGLTLTLPVGTAFQFRCDADSPEPLTVLGATAPPWPGDGEAVTVPGPWASTF